MVSRRKDILPDDLPATSKRYWVYSWLETRYAWLAVVAITAIAYMSSLFNDFVGLDDKAYLHDNPYLKDMSADSIAAIFSTYYNANYHPVTTLVFMIEYHVFGVNAVPFHIVSLLFHLFNTWLVYRFAWSLGQSRIEALVVCVFFALHPFHAESVAWISELKDVLYTAFYLAALLVYIKYIEKPGLMRYLGVAVLFAASLLSKPAAVTLPVLLLAIDYYKGRPINIKALLEKVPLLAMSVAFGILTIKAQDAGGAFHGASSPYQWHHHVFLVSGALVFYLAMFLLPVCFSVAHLFPSLHNGLLPWQYYASLPALIFIAGLVWWWYKRSKLKREIVFGFAFFVVTISVMLQVMSFGSTLIAERYTYVPYIGLAFLLGAYVETVQDSMKKWFAFVLVVGSVVFAVQAHTRSMVWNDDALYDEMLNDNAERTDLADIYCNRASLKAKRGEFQDAIADYTAAIQRDRKYREAYSGRSVALFSAGELGAAIRDLDTAIALDPNHARSYYNRASMYANAGRLPSALQDYNQYLQMNPTDGNALMDRAMVKLNMSDTLGAVNDLQSAGRMGNAEAGEMLRRTVQSK